MSADSIRLSLFVGVFAVMWIAEGVIPARGWQEKRVKRLGVHLILSIANTILLRLVAVGLLIAWIQLLNDAKFGLRWVFGLQGAFEVIVGVVAYDIFDYGWHRLNHEVPFLWRFHRVHHTDTQVDVTTSLRFHPGELLFSVAAKAIWIAVWGPSLWAFVAAETATTAYSQFHHSNLRLSAFWERGVRCLHMTPMLHAAHHTVTPRTRSANYSTIFLIWDRIFGTLKDPRPDEMTEWGLQDDREGHLALGALYALPFRSRRAPNT